MGLDALLARPDLHFGTYDHHVKLQGIKFILDGSVQARTGYFTRDYARGGPDGAYPWHGQPAMGQDAFERMAPQVNDRGWQTLVPVDGDAAIDMSIQGFDAASKQAADERRSTGIQPPVTPRDRVADSQSNRV